MKLWFFILTLICAATVQAAPIDSAAVTYGVFRPYSSSTSDRIDYNRKQEVERFCSGLVSGGTITANAQPSPLFSVAAGVGYINNHENLTGVRVAWSQQNNISIVAEESNYVYVDAGGVVRVSAIKPEMSAGVYLGHVQVPTGMTKISEVMNIPEWTGHFQGRVNEWMSDIAGAMVSREGDGLLVSERPAPNELELNIAGGTAFIRLSPITFAQTYNFKKMYDSADLGRIASAVNVNHVDTSHYNDPTLPAASALVTMTDGFWKKDYVFRVPSGNVIVFYGQQQYESEDLAKTGPLPNIPASVLEDSIPLAVIVSMKGDASIANRIYDVRPYMPRLMGTGSGATATILLQYSSLLGLPVLAQGQTCSGTDKISAYDAVTGTFTCSTDQSAVGGDLSAEPFLTSAASSNLSAERVLSDGANTTVDTGTAGQIKINVADATTLAKGVVQLTGDLAGTATSPSVVDDSHSHTSTSVSGLDAANDITTGTLDGDRLPAMSVTKKGGVPATGTPSGKYLKDDGTWATVTSGAGDVVGPASAVSGNFASFSGTTGKLIADAGVSSASFGPVASKYIVQQADATLSGEQALGALATGILKNTTTTGVLSIATGGDLPTMTATVGGAVPTPPNNTTTFLRGDGTFATPASGGAPTTVQYWVGAADATLSAEKDLSGFTGLVLNTAGTPTSKGTNTCTNQFARADNASGVWTCGSIATADLPTIDISKGGTTETASTEDAVLVGASTTDWVPKVLPSCSNASTSKLLYDSTTNTFSCGTDQTTGGSQVSTVLLAADLANSTVTTAKVTGLDKTAIQPGTYAFKYLIRYQTAALTTGIKFDVNFSGTVTSFVWNQQWVDVSSTASTAAPDQDEILSAGGVTGGFASRAKGTAGRGVTLSVDTANADMLMVIEGLMVVTVAGDLQLYSASEVATSAATVKAGSALILTQIL